MKKSSPAPQDKAGNRAVFSILIFLLGFLCGIAYSAIKTRDPFPVQDRQAAIEQGQETGSDQAIKNLEADIDNDPKNAAKWTLLGNLYFDANRPEKAIAAYQKAIELGGGNADIHTDLGIMYRRSQQPDKALEAFDAAIRLSPEHLPARFNKGIVLLYDLNDPAGAIAAWETVLARAPEAKTPQGRLLREFVDKIRQESASLQTSDQRKPEQR